MVVFFFSIMMRPHLGCSIATRIDHRTVRTILIPYRAPLSWRHKWPDSKYVRDLNSICQKFASTFDLWYVCNFASLISCIPSRNLCLICLLFSHFVHFSVFSRAQVNEYTEKTTWNKIENTKEGRRSHRKRTIDSARADTQFRSRSNFLRLHFL